MNKRDILSAALKVWARTAYKKTSLTDVATELGVTKPALYRHFPNKDALLGALYQDFFDRYAAYLRSRLAELPATADEASALLSMLPSIVEYYALNRDDFVFSFALVLGNPDPGRNMHRELEKRGIPVGRMGNASEKSEASPLVRLAGATAFFFVAIFHLERGMDSSEPSAEEVRALVTDTAAYVRRGLAYKPAEIAALDFAALDAAARVGAEEAAEPSGLLGAVASAVAEAGPWNASMDQVAKRSGLSKSGLYAHFKNKQDMLKQLFLGEFERVTEIVDTRVSRSQIPAERLYLAMAAVYGYLSHRPDILVALDWIRIQRLDLGVLVPRRLFSIFESIGSSGGAERALGVVTLTRWMLFLVVNMLMMETPTCRNACGGAESVGLPKLFTFATLGVEGWST